MSQDVLPESRARETRGIVRHAEHGNLIPIYCANCGKPWGMVPEKHVTFAFALCDACEEKHGIPANLYAEPDSVFWERLQNETLETKASPIEIVKALDDPSSGFAKIAKDWDKHLRRF